MYPTRKAALSIADLRTPGFYGKKLTEQQVIAVRLARVEGRSQRAIAKDFGVTQAAVWSLIHSKPAKTPEERFWKFVRRTSMCWVWTGTVYPKGYGAFHVRDGMYAAHLISWVLAGGRCPEDGEMLLHSCDNRRCVNPDHLRIGTALDNGQDAAKRRRYPVRWGSGSNRARLTWSEVREIRRRVAGGESQNSVAQDIGRSSSTIWGIVNHKSWRDDPVIRIENVLEAS